MINFCFFAINNCLSRKFYCGLLSIRWSFIQNCSYMHFLAEGEVLYYFVGRYDVLIFSICDQTCSLLICCGWLIAAQNNLQSNALIIKGHLGTKVVVSTCLTLLTSVSVFVFASSIVDSSKKNGRKWTKLVLCWTNRDHAHCFVLWVNPNVSSG